MPDPLKVPVQTRPTPVRTDTLFYEQTDGPTLDADRLDYGAAHPNTDRFPNFFLCKEERESLAFGKRWWACENTLQDTYNDNIDYAQEAVAFPKFTRRYVVLRSRYESLKRTVLLPLAGLIGSYVTVAGQDYTQEAIATLSGGTGTGGSVRPIINADGGLCGLIVDDPGTWTVAPTVAITGGNGTGGTATVSVQPQTAVLTAQRKVEFADDDPRRSIFVLQECTYETLPGPEIAEIHFDIKTATDQTTYTQRVAIGTKANPVSAIKISGVSIGTTAAVGLDYVHGFNINDTFPIRIAGVKGSTPAVDGDYTATATGSTTLTIPLHVTGGATVNTGYLSFLKGVTGQVIIDSYVKPDEEAGSVTGTLITVTAILPGRESSDPEYNEQRAAFTDKYQQYVVTGTSSRTAGATYKGQTVEVSNCADPFARSNLSHGPAMALLITETISLPGDDIITPLLDEETGAEQKLIQTRVALPGTPDTIGSTYVTDFYIVESKIHFENVAVGVKVTLASKLPPSRIESVPGSEPMPRIFTFVAGWVFSGDGYQIHGPFLGIAGSGNGNYTLELHAPATPYLSYITYTLGRDVSTVSKFAPLSGRSRFVPIDGLTLHETYALTETGSGGTQTIEEMFVSDPAPGTYAPGNVYIITLHEHPWHGGELGIWERHTIKVVAT